MHYLSRKTKNANGITFFDRTRTLIEDDIEYVPPVAPGVNDAGNNIGGGENNGEGSDDDDSDADGGGPGGAGGGSAMAQPGHDDNESEDEHSDGAVGDDEPVGAPYEDAPPSEDTNMDNDTFYPASDEDLSVQDVLHGDFEPPVIPLQMKMKAQEWKAITTPNVQMTGTSTKVQEWRTQMAITTMSLQEWRLVQFLNASARTPTINQCLGSPNPTLMVMLLRYAGHCILPQTSMAYADCPLTQEK